MKWQEFEAEWKKRMDVHETPLDPDVLWQRIQEKKKRRFIPFWWTLLAGVGLILATWYLTGSLKENNPAASADHTTATRIQPNEATSQAAAPGGQMVEIQTNQEVTPRAASGSMTIEPDAGSVLAEASQARASSPSKPEIRREGRKWQRPAKSVPEKGTTVLAHKIQIEPASTDIALHSPGNMATETAADISERDKIMGFDPLPSPFPSLLPVATLTLSFASDAVQKPRQQHASAWSFLAVAGAHSWMRHFRQAESLPNINGNKRQDEENLESIQAGLLAELAVSSRWNVRSGILYTAQHSVLKTTRTWTESVEGPEQLLSIDQYRNGSLDSILGAGQLTYRYTRSVVNYNRVSYWGIPLELRYTLPLGKWQIRPGAGFVAGLLQKGQGKSINSQNEIALLADEKTYQRSVVASVCGGIGIERRLGLHSSLVLEPRFSFDLSNRLNSNQTHQERFSQVGMWIGWRWRP